MKTLMRALFFGLSCLWAFPSQAESPDPLYSLENFALPATLGKIEEKFQGQSARWVIQIQDVHGHAAAQENIAGIVDQHVFPHADPSGRRRGSEAL